MALISSPCLHWHENTPLAQDYGDVYYSKHDGLAEARHVFLAGNGLPERLADGFTVGETGFGTGLNFLALWQMWAALPEPRPRLHYITTELHPLAPEDLAKAHAQWPELKEYSEALLAVYPPPIAGPHRRWLANGRIQIDFLWGDAAKMLAQYQPAEGSPPRVDAWFLDGFAPSKNPGMWHPALYQAMARLSHPGTTLATFTVAGEVRRGLQEADFTVKKAKGFGHKREMLVGRFRHCEEGSAGRSNPEEFIIIGAGIAGVMSAWRLAKHGHSVTLLEAGAEICAEASGNPASAMTPYFTRSDTPRSRMLGSGFYTMRHILELLRAEGHAIGGHNEGLLLLDRGKHSPRGEKLGRWQRSLILPPEIRREVTAAEAGDIAGLEPAHGGWFYPQGGWVNLRDLCAALLADAGDRISLRLNTAAQSLRFTQGSWEVTTCSTTPPHPSFSANASKFTLSLEGEGKQWRSQCAGEGVDKTFRAKNLVLAAGNAARKLLPDLPLQPVHGQILTFPVPPGFTPPRCVIHAGHALFALPDNRLAWGASFRPGHATAEILQEETERLLHDLAATFPALDMHWVKENATPWAGIRCTTPSRTPLIGPVEGHPPGLFLNLAHGSRGTLSGAAAFAMQAYE